MVLTVGPRGRSRYQFCQLNLGVRPLATLTEESLLEVDPGDIPREAISSFIVESAKTFALNVTLYRCERSRQNHLERARGLNFFRTLISSISLLLDLVGSHCSILPRFYCISYFCEVCLQEPKRAVLLINTFPYKHDISDI